MLAGCVSAFCCIFFFLGALILGVNPLGGTKVISYFIMLCLLFLSLWYFREKVLGGVLHFHQGFVFALLVHLIACTAFAFFIWGYLKIDVALITRHKQESQQFMKFMEKELVKTMGQTSFDQGVKDLNAVMPVDIGFDEFKKRFFILLFFVLVSAFIMRRSPNWSLSR